MLIRHIFSLLYLAVISNLKNYAVFVHFSYIRRKLYFSYKNGDINFVLLKTIGFNILVMD